jgi:hypothetical protein
MKKVSIIVTLGLALVLAGGMIGAIPTPSPAQVYAPPPPPPPPRPSMAPWVGANTPWVFYNGDWFLNGILYYFFGPRYGWAPYYAYPTVYIVRPVNWYAPRWTGWYKTHPVYWENFHRRYPYWRGHQVGHRYDEAFYNRYHRGMGGGWHRGYHGDPH